MIRHDSAGRRAEGEKKREERKIAGSENISRPSMPRAAVSSWASTSTVRKKRKNKQKQRPSTRNAPPSPASKKRKDRSPPPPPKRKARAQKTPSPEKRQARFIHHPSAAVSERIGRAFEHRLYLIEKNHPSPSSCDFIVLGATANVYTVRLDLSPSCTCPDFRRGHTCKHILFVMLRVLKLPMDDPRVWQKALLSAELHDLVHISSVNEAVLASHRVRARFREIAGSIPGGEEGGKEESKNTVQKKLEGDCPVCYEPLREGKEAVVFCRVCGNNVHEDCFTRWRSSKTPETVTCIYCRAAWEDKDKNPKRGDYVNLAAFSDSHTSANTSLEALYPETSMWIQ